MKRINYSNRLISSMPLKYFQWRENISINLKSLKREVKYVEKILLTKFILTNFIVAISQLLYSRHDTDKAITHKEPTVWFFNVYCETRGLTAAANGPGQTLSEMNLSFHVWTVGRHGTRQSLREFAHVINDSRAYFDEMCGPIVSLKLQRNL